MKEKNPKVSVIIPSLDGYRDGNVPRLLEDISRQSYRDLEVFVVKAVKPCSRAHNHGAKRAKGEILVFIDDDIRLGHEKVIENLIGVLNEDERIGIVGASQLIPEDSSWFQRRSGQELYRAQFPVVEKIIDSDMATHACLAIPKRLYFEIGGEDENLLRGDDPDLRYKVRQSGHRVIIVPQTWVYHPMFKNMRGLIKKKFADGMGAAHDFKYFPDKIYELSDGLRSGRFVEKRSFIYRTSRFIFRIGYSIITLKVLRLLVLISYVSGYFCGLFKYRGPQK